MVFLAIVSDTDIKKLSSIS